MVTTTKKRIDNTAILEQVKNQYAKQETENKGNPKIIALIERMEKSPGFSWADFERVTKLSRQAVYNWKQGTIPYESSLHLLRRYLRFTEEDLDRYLRGKINLNELYAKRNSDISTSQKSVEIQRMFKDLDVSEQFATLTLLLQITNDRTTEELNKIPKPKETLELSDGARYRLMRLVEISLLYRSQKIEDWGLDEKEVKAVMEQKNVPLDKDFLAALAQNLSVPIMWSNSVPVLDPSSRFGDDIELLLKELNAEDR